MKRPWLILISFLTEKNDGIKFIDVYSSMILEVKKSG